MCRSFLPVLCLFVLNVSAMAEDFHVHRFERQPLTEEYFSEGANFGDINQDGKPDIVHGPYWWEGPEFKKQHEIYPPKPQNRRGYSDNFFSWIYDFNGDGWNDVLTAGLPGTPGYIYENPGRDKFDQHWARNKIFDQVGNESPQFVNLVGDERPELVCARDGVFGYLSIDPQRRSSSNPCTSSATRLRTLLSDTDSALGTSMAMVVPICSSKMVGSNNRSHSMGNRCGRCTSIHSLERAAVTCLRTTSMAMETTM